MGLSVPPGEVEGLRLPSGGTQNRAHRSLTRKRSCHTSRTPSLACQASMSRSRCYCRSRSTCSQPFRLRSTRKPNDRVTRPRPSQRSASRHHTGKDSRTDGRLLGLGRNGPRHSHSLLHARPEHQLEPEVPPKNSVGSSQGRNLLSRLPRRDRRGAGKNKRLTPARSVSEDARRSALVLTIPSGKK